MSPTKGRTLLYTPSTESPHYLDSPLAAVVTMVHSPECVNLTVFASDGQTFPVTSVLLIPLGAQTPAEGNFCQWPDIPATSSATALAEAVTPLRDSLNGLANLVEGLESREQKANARIADLESRADRMTTDIALLQSRSPAKDAA